MPKGGTAAAKADPSGFIRRSSNTSLVRAHLQSTLTGVRCVLIATAFRCVFHCRSLCFHCLFLCCFLVLRVFALRFLVSPLPFLVFPLPFSVFALHFLVFLHCLTQSLPSPSQTFEGTAADGSTIAMIPLKDVMAEKYVRRCLCPVLPLPSWLRHCICHVLSLPSWLRTAFAL